METKLLKEMFTSNNGEACPESSKVTRSLLGWPPRRLLPIRKNDWLWSSPTPCRCHLAKSRLICPMLWMQQQPGHWPMVFISYSLGTPSRKLHLPYHWPLSTDSPAFLASSCAEHNSAPWVLRHVVAIDVARVIWWLMASAPPVCLFWGSGVRPRFQPECHKS